MKRPTNENFKKNNLNSLNLDNTSVTDEESTENQVQKPVAEGTGRDNSEIGEDDEEQTNNFAHQKSELLAKSLTKEDRSINSNKSNKTQAGPTNNFIDMFLMSQVQSRSNAYSF